MDTNGSGNRKPLAKTPAIVQKNMLTGSSKKNGRSGVPGPSQSHEYHGLTVTLWDGPKWELKGPSDFFDAFGRCGCGKRLYRKHRLASSLLNLIEQVLNTYTPSSGGPPELSKRMSISCDSCGQSLEVDLVGSRTTMGLGVSLTIVRSTQSKMTASTS